MGRSSIALAFLAALAATPSRSAAWGAQSVGRVLRVGEGLSVRPFVQRGGDQRGRGFAGGFAPFEIVPDLTFPAPTPAPFPAGPLLPTPVNVAPPPQPPRCPLIIKVGHGLQHPANTRIVYGHVDCF